MNPFEMVAIIVVAVMIASVFRSRYGNHKRRDRDESEPGDNVETVRLKEEVNQLKQRIQTLERIAVDKENSLAREIEQLRDR